jgi:hypothetical protein
MSGFTATAARKQAHKERLCAENNRYQLCFREIYRASAEHLRVARAADKLGYAPEGCESIEDIILSNIRKEATAMHEDNEQLGYLQRINPPYLATPPPRRNQQPHELAQLERSYEEERCYQRCFIEVYLTYAEQVRVARAADKLGYAPEGCNSIEDIILSNIRKEAIARQQHLAVERLVEELRRN